MASIVLVFIFSSMCVAYKWLYLFTIHHAQAVLVGEERKKIFMITLVVAHKLIVG